MLSSSSKASDAGISRREERAARAIRHGDPDKDAARERDDVVPAERGHEVTLFASGDSETSARLVASTPRALRLDDDVIDAIDDCAGIVRLYQISLVRPDARELSRIIKASTAQVVSAMKALGTGHSRGVLWKDIEVVRQFGPPQLRLHGGAARRADPEAAQHDGSRGDG